MNEEQKQALRVKYGIQGGTAKPTGTTASLDSITDPQERLAELKRQAGLGTTKSLPPEKKSVGGFAKNVVTSGADLIGGIVQAITHPIQTAKGLGNIVLGAGQKLAGYDGEAAGTIDQIVDMYKQRYGKDIKETLYNDPVGVLADLSTILGGGGALLRGVGTASKISDVARVSGAADKAIRYGRMAEKGAIATDPLRLAGKGVGIVSRETGLTDTASKAKKFTETLFKGTDEVPVRGATATGGLRETIQKTALDSGMDKQTQTILRKSKPGETKQQTAKRLEEDYNTYSKAEEMYKVDPGADNALQVVGSQIGNGYKKVIEKYEELGKMIGKARKEAKTPVQIEPAQKFITGQLSENGIIKTPRGYKIQKGYTTKLTTREIKELLRAEKELNKLKKNPSAENLSNFKERIAKDIDFSKPMGKSLPDAERIMRGVYNELAEALNVKSSPDLQGIYAMNKEYERLSKLLGEGEGILGKKTLTGDYRHDAGLAKASIKSLHSGAKKDFLQALGQETSEDYIQKSIVAAQAMKDMGNFQQASLLEELASGAAQARRTDLTPSNLINRGVDKLREKGTEMVAGTPRERTTRFIQEGAGKIRGRVKKATESAKAVPVKEVGRVRKIVNEALRQAGYTAKEGGSAIRVRNAQIREMLGLDQEQY